jgi:hypothetical protein
MRQIVILAHSSDAGAQLVASGLGASSVRVLQPEALSIARWSHRVDSRGRAVTRIAWPDNSLDSSSIGAVLNRLRYLPVPRFENAAPKDRDYAGAELQALILSWLGSLGAAAIHPVRSHPLLVPNLPPQHWAKSAAACGIPLARRTVATGARALHMPRAAQEPSFSESSQFAGSVMVAGDRAGGTLAEEFGDQCRNVSKCLGLPLLEFNFAMDGLAWVETYPSLSEPWACSLAVELLWRIARSGS